MVKKILKDNIILVKLKQLIFYQAFSDWIVKKIKCFSWKHFFILTKNVQVEKNITIAGNSTSALESMPNANDSTKAVITILGYYRSGGPFTINTSSTGFTITNNNSGQETASVLAFRIG